MGLLSFLLGNQPIRTKFTDPSNNDADLLLVDATIQESPKYEAEPTDYAVEEGPDVTDNIRLKPITLQIDGLVSETPITLKSQAAGLLTAVGANLGAKTGGFNSQLGAIAGGFIGSRLFKDSSEGTDANGDTRSLNPADIARKVLEDTWRNKRIFTVVTKRRKYDSMVITSLTFPRTVQDGKALKFSVSLKQIRIVSPETIAITKNIESNAAHGAPKTNLGQQSASALNDQKKNQGSLLFQGLTKLGFGG